MPTPTMRGRFSTFGYGSFDEVEAKYSPDTFDAVEALFVGQTSDQAEAAAAALEKFATMRGTR